MCFYDLRREVNLRLKNKKGGVQVSMFPETNMVSLEDYKKSARKPVQHEKKFMNSVMQVARTLDLPCLHLDYFCGNKFYATCINCSNNSHQVRAVCPVCHKPVLVTCLNRINKHLAGHYDILGLEWAIETKHKINKGKQVAKNAPRQENKSFFYNQCSIPNITVNESDDQEIFDFLRKLHNKKYPERQI